MTARLRETDLSGADLTSARLRYASLEGAQLLDVNLSGADLSHARGLTAEILCLTVLSAATRLPADLADHPRIKERIAQCGSACTLGQASATISRSRNRPKAR
ncbi:pentapeptide repeat-containing protein [Streptomyces sp. NPDC003753]